MSTGTGIFLASIVIALVLLYLKTRDEWQWSSIPRIILKHKKIVMQLMAFSATVVFLIYLSKWTQAYIKKTEAMEVRAKINEERSKELQAIENRKIQILEQEIAEKKARVKQEIAEKKVRVTQFEEKLANEKAILESPGEDMPYQINYGGFLIGMTKKECLYLNGNGEVYNTKNNYHNLLGGMEATFWWDVGEHLIYKDEYKFRNIRIRFNDDKLDAILIDRDSQYWSTINENCGKNRKTAYSINTLKEKFGKPSKESVSDDDLSRIYYFDEYGIVAVLSRDRVKFYIIYDPTTQSSHKNILRK